MMWADGLLPCKLGVVSEKEEWVSIIRTDISPGYLIMRYKKIILSFGFLICH